LTGLSGAGKTTIASALSEHFVACNILHEVLDGDLYRAVFSPHAGYSEKERNEFRCKILFIAKLLNKHNVSCIIPLLSSSRNLRERAREELHGFVEVYVKCPLDICKERDPKGLYRKAAKSEKPNIVGIDLIYEEPKSPELIIDTSKAHVESCVQSIINKIKQFKYI
jgi:adenylyl-sulfate kinase